MGHQLMESRSKFLFKNIGILTASNFASKLLVFLLVPLYTSVLSTVDVGIFDLIVSTVSILFHVLTADIINGIMRFALDRDKSKSEIAIIGLKYSIISIIILIICVISIRLFNLVPRINGLESYIILYFAFYVLNNFMIQFAKGLERISDMGIAAIMGTLSMIVTNIIFLLVLKQGLKGFFVANIVAQAIPTIFLFFKIRFWEFIYISYINKYLEKEMLFYSVPLIAASIGWWINSASDKYVVSFMCGVSANGILAVSYKIPQIINTLHGIFTEAWRISAIREYQAEDSSIFYGRTFRLATTLMAAVCSWLILLSKPLAHILYAKDFYAAWQYVPFLLISCTFNSASGFLGSVLSANKNSKAMANSAISGSSANLIVNIILVYVMGIQGAVIATAICSFIIFYIRKRETKGEIEITGYHIIVITWILLCVQAFIEIHIQSYVAELIIMIAMLIINSRNISSLYKFALKQIKKT